PGTARRGMGQSWGASSDTAGWPATRRGGAGPRHTTRACAAQGRAGHWSRAGPTRRPTRRPGTLFTTGRPAGAGRGRGGAALAGRRDGAVFAFGVDSTRWEATWALCRTPVTAVALGPEERTALVGTELGRLFLVEVPSGEVLRELTAHRGPISGVCFAGDDL